MGHHQQSRSKQIYRCQLERLKHTNTFSKKNNSLYGFEFNERKIKASKSNDARNNPVWAALLTKKVGSPKIWDVV